MSRLGRWIHVHLTLQLRLMFWFISLLIVAGASLVVLINALALTLIPSTVPIIPLHSSSHP
jgi:hypothetical protein